MIDFVDLDKPYHVSYHEDKPLTCNGPYQYSIDQIEQMSEIDRANKVYKAAALRAMIRNPIKTFIQESPIFESFTPEPIEEPIIIESISKEEFKQLEYESIMAEWRELIGEAEIEIIPFELEY